MYFKDANSDVINDQDSEGRTALHLAVAHQNEAAVKVLLSLDKCKVSAQDNMNRSPLHWAAVLGLLNEILSIIAILQFGAQLDRLRKYSLCSLRTFHAMFSSMYNIKERVPGKAHQT